MTTKILLSLQIFFFLLLGGTLGQSKNPIENLVGTWKLERKETRIMEANPHGSLRGMSDFLIISVTPDQIVRLHFSDSDVAPLLSPSSVLVLFSDGRGEENITPSGQKTKSTTRWTGKALIRKFKSPRIKIDQTPQEITESLFVSKDLQELYLEVRVAITSLPASPNGFITTKYKYRKV